MHKRTIAISLSALAVAALTGGAYAATRSGSAPRAAKVTTPPVQAVINDAARRLNVTPARLTGALKGAMIDQVNAAASAGRLPKAAAKAITQRLEHTPGLPLGPGLFGPGLIPPMLSLHGAGPVICRAGGPPPTGTAHVQRVPNRFQTIPGGSQRVPGPQTALGAAMLPPRNVRFQCLAGRPSTHGGAPKPVPPPSWWVRPGH